VLPCAEKKTTPEDKIIAMTKRAKGVSKEHRPGAVARPSVRSDGLRALMAKKTNEPGEREKSERNLDYLQVSYDRYRLSDCNGFRILENIKWRQSASFVAMCLFLRLLNLAGH
jgi:hypothetical protein